MAVRISLNDRIKVKLTKRGLDIFRERNRELSERLMSAGVLLSGIGDPVTDEDGYSYMQLWQFIQIYGSHISSTEAPVIMPASFIDLDAEPTEEDSGGQNGG